MGFRSRVTRSVDRITVCEVDQNDFVDAEAIAEAGLALKHAFLAIKTVGQLEELGDEPELSYPSRVLCIS